VFAKNKIIVARKMIVIAIGVIISKDIGIK